MTTGTWFITGLILIAVLLYRHTTLKYGLVVVFGYLGVWSLLTAPATAMLLAVWIGFGVFASLLAWPPLRRAVVSTPILSRLRRVLPPISRTEREALESGTVWWEAELFSGAPDWQRLFDTEPPALTADEQAFVDGPTETLCAMLDDWEITHQRRDLPPTAWQFIRTRGFFGLIIPQHYGGRGFSAAAHSAVVMKLASRSVTAAVTVMVPNSLGPAELLLAYGTAEQKDYYLPRLACGEEIPCFALTGPEAGSDAAGLTDSGVICRQPFGGDPACLGIRLNWDKRYITLGPVATVMGLAFRLYDPDQLLGDIEDVGITLALVPTDRPGVEIGRRHLPLDVPFQNGPTRGRDVFIPLDWIIGGRERAGQGWHMLMESLAAGRAISLPALSTGGAQLAARVAGAYARIRRQFGLPLGHFEGIEEPLGRIGGRTYQMEATRRLTLAAVMAGEKPAVASAIAKYQLTERMRGVVTDAMDILGGKGICVGPRNLLSPAYQALPIGITVEGANILTRSLILFGQGAIRCHPFIRQEMTAAMAADTAAGLRQFDAALSSHVGYTLRNAVRALVAGLSGGRITQVPAPRPLRRYLQRIDRMSVAFALAADITMLSLGGRLKRREKLSGRLADVLGELYLASAVLHHYHHRGSPPAEWPLVRWSLEDGLYRMRHALDELCRNFPIRPVGWLLSGLIFPLGRPGRSPADALGHEVAKAVQSPGEPRDSLTGGIYLPGDTDEPLSLLEAAFLQVTASEPLERKIRQAASATRPHPQDIELAQHLGVIDAGEAEALRRARALVRRVIAVDEFASDFNDIGAAAASNPATVADEYKSEPELMRGAV